MCNLIFSMLFPIKVLSIIAKCIMEQISVTVMLPLSLLLYVFNQLLKSAYKMAAWRSIRTKRKIAIYTASTKFNADWKPNIFCSLLGDIFVD